jgi:hypothetical protein
MLTLIKETQNNRIDFYSTYSLEYFINVLFKNLKFHLPH